MTGSDSLTHRHEHIDTNPQSNEFADIDTASLCRAMLSLMTFSERLASSGVSCRRNCVNNTDNEIDSSSGWAKQGEEQERGNLHGPQ